ncbi:SpvB/TcaC N-terminal domain-containing protein [Flavobacterium longum]|uniref:SpvB/TcaC N-terminal domain-containing protein n=1 Tax=Flavobacterium longum TaxID=1299340 RepID=UPI0039E96194
MSRINGLKFHFARNQKAHFTTDAIPNKSSIIQSFSFASINRKPAAAPIRSITYSIKPDFFTLRKKVLPELEYGMTNVTANEGWYSLINPMHNEQHISMAYDPDKIPAGYLPTDINIYWFDKKNNHWTEIKRDSISIEKKTLYATSTEDGDFISAILKAPESPETKGYAPTQMSGIEFADPAAKINIIAPPTANNQGTANLSYPIELPPGRNGMQPTINVNYNSDNGNGMLGEGWSIGGISSISVDTRWGAARYSNDKKDNETETYLLDGQMLAAIHKGEAKLAHINLNMPRTEVSEFRFRKESSFKHIKREGNSPSNYHWVVTDKSGTKYFYGGNGQVDPDAVLKNEGNNNIAEWKITRVEDVHGNIVDYKYLKTTGNDNYIFPKTIEYTKTNPNINDYYRIHFEYGTDREDKLSLNGRYGFLTNANALKLNTITITYQYANANKPAELARKYSFDYRTGAFSKTLLKSITQFGSDGKTQFAAHQFTYHNEKGTSEKFSAPKSFDVNPINAISGLDTRTLIKTNGTSAIGGSKSSSISGGIYVGAGPGVDVYSVDNSAGVIYRHSMSSSEGINTFVDIDGDARPDRVYLKNGKLNYEKNESINDILKFAAGTEIIGAKDFFNESSRTSGWGGESNFGPVISYERATTESVTERFFADSNGDGLMDIINRNSVLFNTGKKDASDRLKFSPLSSDTPVTINANGVTRTILTYSGNAKDDEDLIEDNPLNETVRVWEVPYDGTVNIKAPISRIVPALPSSDYDTADTTFASVEYEGKTLPGMEIGMAKGDNAIKNLIKNDLQVTKGKKIYFRLRAGHEREDNGAYDEVNWNPIITYTQYDGIADEGFTSPAIDRKTFEASKDFLLSNKMAATIPADATNIRITGSFQKLATMDDIKVQVLVLKDTDMSVDKVHFEQTFKSGDTPNTLDVTNPNEALSAGQKIQFVIKSDVNIDLHNVTWEPTIEYEKRIEKSCFDRTETVPCTPPEFITVNEKLLEIPYYVFKDSLIFKGNYHKFSADKDISIHPVLDLSQVDKCDGSFTVSVKTPQRVIAKKEIVYANGQLQENLPLEFNLKADTPFIVSIEGPNLPLNSKPNNNFAANITAAGYYYPGNGALVYFEKSPVETPSINANRTTIVPTSGTYKIIPSLSVKNNTQKGDIKMQVWVNDVMKTETTITYDNNSFSLPINYLSVDMLANQKLCVQLICKDETLLFNPDFKGSFTANLFEKADLVTNRGNQTFGPMYRNWGQFVYNGMNDRAKNPIVENDLVIAKVSEDEVNTFKADVNTSVSSGQAMDRSKTAVLDKVSSGKATFSIMLPKAFADHRNWVGGEKQIYLNKDKAGASRLGLDDVKKIDPFQPVTGAVNSYGYGVPKVSKSTMHTITASYGVSGNKSWGDFQMVSDFIDMNGDRYPDVLNESKIQFTNADGSLGMTGTNSCAHKGDSESNGMSTDGKNTSPQHYYSEKASGNRTTSATEHTGESAKGSMANADSGIGKSVAFNQGSESTSATWIDVNSDGLPDGVSGSSVQLNLGYGQYKPITQSFQKDNTSFLSKVENISVSPGISTGFSFLKNSFSAGVAVSFSDVAGLYNIQDMNGDGLADKVTTNYNGSVSVEINTGDSFMKPIDWLSSSKGGDDLPSIRNFASFDISYLPQVGGSIISKWFGFEKVKTNASVGVSVGFSTTFGFSPVIIPVKVVFNPSANTATGIGKTTRQFIDVNGDGFLDHVYSNTEDKIEVQFSNLGKTNKLETVTNPLNGTFTLDYAHTTPSPEHPGGKWAMSELVIDDGISSDRDSKGVKFDSRQQFSYEGGHYDRFEREFLGFGTVKTTDLGFNGKKYRDRITSYNTNNYYFAGMLEEEVQQDSAEPANKYGTTKNKYQAYAVVNGPGGGDGVVFVALDYKLNGTFEKTNNVLWFNKSTYKYNKNGDLEKFTYKENPSRESDSTIDYQTTVKYLDDLTHYIIGLPIEVLTENPVQDKLFRRSTAEYYDWGVDGGQDGEKYRRKLKSLKLFYGNPREPEVSETTFTYDRYGNVETKTLPNGIRYTYEYENRLFSHISKISDNQFALDNFFSDFDYRYGIAEKTTLTNGNTIRYKFDQFGRATTIIGGLESIKGDVKNTFTLSFRYGYSGKTAYALTRHYDVQNKADGIYTIKFSDGFKRPVQVKKTGIVEGVEKWIISGRQVYDAFGRVIMAYYPTDEKYDVNNDVVGNTGLTFNQDFDSITPTVTTYDIQDRVTETKLPDKKVFSTISYQLGTDAFGELSRVTVETFTDDKASSRKDVFRNGSGLASTEIEYLEKPAKKPVTISYKYDDFHQLEDVLADNVIVMRNRYDFAGWRIKHYDANGGTTTYHYNNSGQIDKKTMPDDAVTDYIYHYGRLTEIQYQGHPEDNVKYTYGTKTAGKESNGIGQIIFQEDATGAQSFRYDPLGNVVENTRTIIAPFHKTYTFTTKFEYDSFGRLQHMTYPGEEKVVYKYNKGGLLESVNGYVRGEEKKPDYPYVEKITYNKFEQKTTMLLGNGVTTKYAYYPARQTLKSMSTSKAGVEFSNCTYDYDDQDNVTLIKRNSKPTPEGLMGVVMQHSYTYDNMNQLKTGTGDWNKNSHTYELHMDYGNYGNISRKKLQLTSPTVNRDITDDYGYRDASIPMRVTNIGETITRKTVSGINYNENNNTYIFDYDKNGNNNYRGMGNKSQLGVSERKIIWDQENRVRAVSNDGYVSSYTYDAAGARTIKMSTQSSGTYMSGKLVNEQSSALTFSLYANPYFSMRNTTVSDKDKNKVAGIGTKHIYIGIERIASQLTDMKNWVLKDDVPKQVQCGEPGKGCGSIVDYKQKMTTAGQLVNNYYDDFDLPHKFLKPDAFETVPAVFYQPASNPGKPDAGNVSTAVTKDENLRYFYHSGNVGNINMVTGKDGKVLQYLEYLPFGEVFMEQRQDYSSQFTFNAKETDQETGLAYYGARYYDPQTYLWLSIDPMAEKYTGKSPFNFSLNNPVKVTDPDGRMTESDPLFEYAPRCESDPLFDPAPRSYDELAKAFRTYTPKKRENGWEDRVSNAGGWVGVATTPFDFTKASIGNNFKLYQSGWGGNQYVATIKISKIGSILGWTTLGVGTALDVHGVINYFGNDPSNYIVHPVQATLNLSIGVIAMYNPVVAVGSAAYFVIDIAYPGAVGSYLYQYGKLDAEMRRTTGQGIMTVPKY